MSSKTLSTVERNEETVTHRSYMFLQVHAAVNSLSIPGATDVLILSIFLTLLLQKTIGLEPGSSKVMILIQVLSLPDLGQ